MLLRITMLVTLFCAVSGCANWYKSRYAMDDPVYAAKYHDGAKKTEPLKKIKQAIDARHVKGLDGGFIGGGGQWRHGFDSTLVGIDLGYEHYPSSWFSSRSSLAGYVGHGDWYAGVDLGFRVQTPTRLAPFVGVGSFNGFSTTYADASDDGEDNDDDGYIDERSEKEIAFDGALSSIYPELGCHFWPIGQARFSLYSRYLVTTEGRAHDDWLVGLQYAIFDR